MLRPEQVESLETLREPLRGRLLSTEYGISEKVDGAVREIIARVRNQGDAAVAEYTQRFDQVALTPDQFLVSQEDLDRSAAQVTPELRAAIDQMIANVRAFHECQWSNDFELNHSNGSQLRWHIRPLESVAVYVPGGLAAYPTTVVMNTVPAQIAGVERIVALTPPGSVENNPAVGYALQKLGVGEIVRLGGAQAIAAAAYGTQSLRPVCKIVGPGNAFVAAAKRQVYGRVGIDSIAGPSEVVIVADGNAPAEWIAWDMLAQAEHDEAARSILITSSQKLADEVCGHVRDLVEGHPRAEIIRPALDNHGSVCVVPNLEVAVTLTNAIAPEHLQVMVSEECEIQPEDFVAGAVFWGRHSPTAIGDYWAGPNHVLPTGGTARYRGPLSVDDFRVPMSIVRYNAQASRSIEPAIELAESEGLYAHASALRARWRASKEE